MFYTTNHRISEHVAVQSDQDTGVFPNQEAGAEVTISGLGAHCQEVDHAGAELEESLALDLWVER